jgi:hypothetical protein
VIRRARFGQAPTKRESSGAASMTCSRLSSRRSIFRSPMCSTRPSLAPSTCTIVSVTSAGSRSEPSPTQKTPALYSGTTDAAASIASRVLPEPPGPVRVRIRAPPPMRSTTSDSSRSRPTKELRTRQVRIRDRLERREGALPELEDLNRPLEVLQPVLTEVDARDALRRSVARAEERNRRRRDEDLSAITGGGDARRPKNVGPDVLVLGEKGRSGMQSHAHADRPRLERLCDLGCSRERSRCGRKRDEERVALRVHLDATIHGAGIANNAPVLRKRPRVLLYAGVVEQPGRALDVREEEGDGACREAAHRATMTARAQASDYAPLSRRRQSARIPMAITARKTGR